MQGNLLSAGLKAQENLVGIIASMLRVGERAARSRIARRSVHAEETAHAKA